MTDFFKLAEQAAGSNCAALQNVVDGGGGVATTPNETNGYPRIENAIYSPQAIRELRSLAFGRHGEMTGLSSYVSQSIVVAPFDEEVSRVLAGIAEREMVHLQLLLSAIRDFGGKVEFVTPSNMYWSARYVSTQENVVKMLEEDIKGERDSVAEYSRVSSLVKNQSLAALLGRIAEDEMEHIRILQGLLANQS